MGKKITQTIMIGIVVGAASFSSAMPASTLKLDSCTFFSDPYSGGSLKGTAVMRNNKLGTWQYNCHGELNEGSPVPEIAFHFEGLECSQNVLEPYATGMARGVVTPSGRVSYKCTGLTPPE